MTEEKLQGAIDLINELAGTSLELERNDWNWILKEDETAIADGNLENLWDIVLSEAKDLLN